jgi:hypothetical protein
MGDSRRDAGAGGRWLPDEHGYFQEIDRKCWCSMQDITAGPIARVQLPFKAAADPRQLDTGRSAAGGVIPAARPASDASNGCQQRDRLAITAA